MACGDGELDVGEGCDDGNLDAGDGCDASCAVEAPKYAVLAQRPPFSTRFYLYNVQAGWTEQWVTLPANLGTILLTPAVSADHVYILAEDTNMVWKYSLDAGTWSMHGPGPVALPNTAGFMEWVGDGLCLAYWTVKELHCHDGVEWRKIPLTISPGLGASWIPRPISSTSRRTRIGVPGRRPRLRRDRAHGRRHLPRHGGVVRGPRGR
ncbi:hypothetical protein [Nannocystis pusilla]|uniref:hypothetical protein n=1 Tax=Nannocystis pusilla TaxID=889268 RepID=UPI003B7E20CE